MTNVPLSSESTKIDPISVYLKPKVQTPLETAFSHSALSKTPAHSK